MKINYKGYEVEGTVEEIKKLIEKKNIRITGTRGRPRGKMSEEHKRKISKALQRNWAEKKKYKK